MATTAKKRPQNQARKSPQDQSVAATLARLQQKDPGLKQLLKNAYGYAVFPSVGKAALVVGGAYGRGEVFERGKLIGYATIGQTTIGVQIGGDTFSELVVFENRESLERFKKGRTTFAANASAVLVKAGAAATRDFEKGVAVFAYSEGGLMLEAAIGGQKFRFKPVTEGEGTQSSRGGGKVSGRRGSAEDKDSGGDDEDAGAPEDSDESGDGAQDETSSTGGFVKDHPFIAGAIGAVALGGVALLLMKALRSGDQSDDEQSDADEEEDDDTQASDESEQGSDDEEGDEESDEGDEEDADDAGDAEAQDDDRGEDDYEEEDDDEQGEEDEEGDEPSGSSSRNRDRGHRNRLRHGSNRG